ncbi:MAG: acetate/propionate family kinase [Burkholderiaceae bacterium]|nr:acetate/propionate family kinase [Burkholderiaceae bacterium]
MACILVLNSGSSSIKFASYVVREATPRLTPTLQGHVAQHADGVELLVRSREQGVLAQLVEPAATPVFECEHALERLIAWLEAHEAECGGQLLAVGHRVVHGGQRFNAPVRVSSAVLAELAHLNSLAPLHQPRNLKAIEILRSHRPALLQVACFDTAFHSSQPEIARALALPRHLTEQGVRRYGFHGLSYEYIASQLPKVLGERAGGRVVVAHLGSGASMCALLGGRSMASTMGFSALDGLVMGSRCGNLDPGVLLYLLQEQGLNAQQLSDMLYSQSGLLGVSGLSADMQALLESPDPHASQAIELFVYRAVTAVGSLAAALGGLDTLVFSAGIGEHAAPVRAAIAQGCGWLGAELDEAANRVHAPRISTPASRVQLLVLPTDEEAVIAGHTLDLL